MTPTPEQLSEIRREAEAYAHRSDERGRLAGHVLSLLAEVERRGQLLDEWQALQDKITAELEAAGWRVRTVDATVSALLARQKDDERRYLLLRDAGDRLADALAPFAVGALPSDGAEEWDALVSAAQSSLAEWRKTR